MSVNEKKTTAASITKAYLEKENAAAWLRKELDLNGYTRRAAYHLSIINNIFDDHEEKIYKRLPAYVLGGMPQGKRRNVEASFVARANESPVRPGSGGLQAEAAVEPPFARWDRQEAALEKWAEGDGCWHDDIEAYAVKRFGEEISHGNEARVFRYDPTHVVKIWDSRFDPQKNLDRISITNFFMPDTGYELLGMGRNADGAFCMLVKQPFIIGNPIGTGSYAIDAFDTFDIVREDAKKENPRYCTQHFVLGDLHDRNVIRDIHYIPRVIDCNLELNTPDLGLGGTWIVPDVKWTDKGLGEIDAFLDYIIPKQSARDSLEATVGKLVPDFSAQLDAKGRYEGALTLPLRGGGKETYVFQMRQSKGRHDEDTLLYAKPENILALLSTNGKFSQAEKKTLSQGRYLIKGGKKHVFDLNTGRVRVVVDKSLKTKLGNGIGR